MRDTKVCPICGLKMRTINLKNKKLHNSDKASTYAERTCSKGLNHTVMFFSDTVTGQVDFLKLSLTPKYSKFLEIDYINQKCRIACKKEGKTEYIDIPKLLIPDFPHLADLKSKVDLYVVFS
jgi:hypothetical protein